MLNYFFTKRFIKILLYIGLSWITFIAYIYIEKTGLFRGYNTFILQKGIITALRSEKDYINISAHTNFTWSKLCVQNVFKENEENYTYDFAYTEFAFDDMVIKIKHGTFCNRDDAITDAIYCYNNSSSAMTISTCTDKNGKIYRYLDISK